MSNGTGSDFIYGVDQDLIGTEDLSVEGQKSSLEPTSDEQEAKREKATEGFNPTLVLGLGGTGLKALDSLKKMMLKQEEGIRPGLALLGFDCDENEVKKPQVLQPHVEVFPATLKNPKAFKRNNEICHEWATQKKFPANALYGASQYRQISRMCLFHHFGKIQDLLREAINSIASTATGDFTVRLDVYIVTSICGGAGSGMYTDIAVLLREIASELALDITLISLFVTGDVYTRHKDVPSRQHPRMLANTYACLKELQYFQDENSPHNTEGGGSEPMVFKYPGDIQISLNRPLFDLVLLVESSNVKGKPTIKSPDQLNQFLSNVLFLMTCAPLTENNISMWTNPESGFNMTFYHVNNSPRCFSSLAYAKFMYPEYELVNFLYSSCCKSILEYFLDAVVLKNISEEQRHDPDRVDPQNRIRAIIQEDMDTHGEWEVPDFVKYYEENVLSRKRFDADELKRSLKETARADWDEMKSDLATFRKDQDQKLKEMEKSLRNYQALCTRNFDNFLKKLPYDLIENGVGVRWLKTYFQLLKKELDQEEKEANDKKEGETKKRTEIEKTFNQEWDDVKRFIDNKPFFRARSKLEDQFNAIVGDMAEYYNSRLTESTLETVINTYKAMDEIINKRANLLERIIPKFDTALQNYREKERKFRDQLERIAGEKGEESYHMEFSAIDLEQMRTFQQRLFKEHDPQSAMKSIFGRTEDKQKGKKTRDFWEYESSGYKAQHVMLYMRSFVSEWVKKYQKNLDSVLNDLNVGQRDFYENLERLKKMCSAQWKYSDIIAGVGPVDEEATAYPRDFSLVSNNKFFSTSDRQVEMIRIEYGMPGPLLTDMSVWRKKYDSILSKSSDRNFHILPQADMWHEADEFVGDFKESGLRLFALGLAFGRIYEPDENERKALEKKYGKKEYRCFIFRRGNHFYLMPFYELPAQPNKMANELIELGRNRKEAFQTFTRDKNNSKMILDWIQDRIAGSDISEITEKLVDYMDNELDKQTRSSSQSEAQMATKEMEQIQQYLDLVQRDKQLSAGLQQ